jgi:hypothetical protein
MRLDIQRNVTPDNASPEASPEPAKHKTIQRLLAYFAWSPLKRDIDVNAILGGMAKARRRKSFKINTLPMFSTHPVTY